MSGDIKAKWEFRIFFPLDDSGQLPFNIFQVLGTAPTETERGRIDEYVPVSSTVGVKYRDGKELEVKVFGGRDRSGAEYWVKFCHAATWPREGTGMAARAEPAAADMQSEVVGIRAMLADIMRSLNPTAHPGMYILPQLQSAKESLSSRGDRAEPLHVVALAKGARHTATVGGVSVEQSDFSIAHAPTASGRSSSFEGPGHDDFGAGAAGETAARWGTVCLESKSMQKLERLLHTEVGDPAMGENTATVLAAAKSVRDVRMGGFPAIVANAHPKLA